MNEVDEVVYMLDLLLGYGDEFRVELKAAQDRLLTRFASVDILLGVNELTIIADTIEKYMPNLDVSDVNLELSRNNFCYYNHATRALAFLSRSRIMSQRVEDYIFLILHELRHIEQNKRGLLSYEFIGNHDAWLIWHPTNDRRLGTEVQRVVTQDTLYYHQLPWEADANGFAHHAMGSYIPQDELMAQGVKFCTIPV